MEGCRPDRGCAESGAWTRSSPPLSLQVSGFLPLHHSGPGDTLQWGLHSVSQRLQAHPCPCPLDASMTIEDAPEPDCEPLVLSEDSQAAAWVQIPVLCSGASSPSLASFQFLICKMGMNVNNYAFMLVGVVKIRQCTQHRLVLLSHARESCLLAIGTQPCPQNFRSIFYCQSNISPSTGQLVILREGKLACVRGFI